MKISLIHLKMNSYQAWNKFGKTLTMTTSSEFSIRTSHLNDELIRSITRIVDYKANTLTNSKRDLVLSGFPIQTQSAISVT